MVFSFPLPPTQPHPRTAYAAVPPPPPPPTCPPAGVEQIYGLGELNEYEKAGLKAMMPELRASIEKGLSFAKEG
jgi:hypothetical protein